MRQYLIGFIVTLFMTASFSRLTLADDKEIAEATAAQEAFHQSHYTEALGLYSTLYVHYPDRAGYVWNLARCHQFLGHPDEAITYFNKYMSRTDVTDAKRQEARTYIAAMERLKATPVTERTAAVGQVGSQATQGAAVTAHAPPAVPSGAQSESGGALRVTGLVIAGVGVAGLVAGTLFGVQAQSAAKDLKDNVAPGKTYDSTLQAIDDRGRSAQTKEWIFLGAGGAALITGGILYFVGHSQGGEATSTNTAASIVVMPRLLPHDVGAALSVTF